MNTLKTILNRAVNIKLMMRQVTTGKKKEKLPLFMNMSPGSFPSNGIFGQKMKSTPNMTRKIPIIINNLPILSNPDIILNYTIAVDHFIFEAI